MNLAPLLPAPLLAAAVGLASVHASAERVDPSEVKDRTEPLPRRLQGIDVVEQLDAPLPADVGFTDQDGRSVRLGDYFGKKRPVILTLNYSDCPMLCSLELDALVKSLADVDLEMGRDFDVVTIGLDPTETPEKARRTRDRYVARYGRPEAASGWHFLTGPEANTRAVAAAVGFSYAWNEKRSEWVHPAAIAVATPDARIARYLYGIQYHPKTVRLTLVEASQGKIGSTVDKLILYCFHFDETEGRYAPVAMNVMRVGGGLAVALLGGFLTFFWIGESRRKNRERTPTETPS